MSTASSPEARRNCAKKLREEALRARRLALTLSQDSDRQRLTDYAEELEREASRLEQ